MEAPFVLTLDSPTSVWTLVQFGFLVRVVRWDDFYTAHKLVVKIYDLIKLTEESKTRIALKDKHPINEGDDVYRDITTGNYLVVSRLTADTNRILVIKHV